ncbi:MAG: MATE family efflux transporter [Solobacterium sp.]|nr:MATE family efflux transporter [Solobacterium sp.]
MPISHETSQHQYERMTKTPVAKLIIVLGIPTMISMLITNIYNLVDTYFVGTIGTSAAGATGIVFILMAILQAFGFMYGHGAGSNISRKLGSHDVESAKRYASTSFYLSIFTGILILIIGLVGMDFFLRLFGSTETILPYARTYAFYILIAGPALCSSCVLNNILRYEGMAFFAMLGLTTGGILNIFLDALFVSYLGMGIAGAGLATAISQYISFVILLLPYLRGVTQSKIAFQYFMFNPKEIFNIAAVGSPSFARQGLASLSTSVVNLLAGNYGDAAIAAISIVSRICSFLFCIAIGIGQGFQPVCAFNYGASIFSRVKKGFYVALLLGTVVMTCLGILGYLNAGSLVALFRKDAEVVRIGEVALRYQCIALPLMPLSMYGNMLFQAIGQAKKALFLASLRSGLLMIPTVLILHALFGLLGIQMAQAISDSLTALLSVPFILNYFKNMPKDGTSFAELA